MFFTASKIIGALLSPLNFILLLLLAGTGLLCIWRRAGQFLIGAGIGLFFVLGVTPLGHNLLVGLENRYERPAQLPPVISGILILGGTFDAQISAARHAATVNDSMERVLEGVRLAQENPLAVPVFSGGEGRLLQKAQPEAREAAQWLAQMGYERDRFLFEDESHNTWENVQFTMDMMNPGSEEIWVVVTSAYHMPRAMAVFEVLNWPGQVIPWPTDYQTDGRMRFIPQSIDVQGNFYKFSLWWHEVLGTYAYSRNLTK